MKLQGIQEKKPLLDLSYHYIMNSQRLQDRFKNGLWAIQEKSPLLDWSYHYIMNSQQIQDKFKNPITS